MESAELAAEDGPERRECRAMPASVFVSSYVESSCVLSPVQRVQSCLHAGVHRSEVDYLGSRESRDGLLELRSASAAQTQSLRQTLRPRNGHH
eukprot:5213518-Amphidinium_carterae.1